jgi:ribonuclease R
MALPPRRWPTAAVSCKTYYRKLVPRQSAPLITGRLNVHRDGYGFLIADRPVEGAGGDVFLPPDAAAKAMHGDRVAVRITRLGRAGRAEGDIVRILERAHETVVGLARFQRRGLFVEPHDDRIRQRIYIPSQWALPKGGTSADRIGAPPLRIESAGELDGMIVNVEIAEFPRGGNDASGRIIEVLGRPDDFGVDVEITIRKFHLPHRFPPDVLEEAARTTAEIPERELSRRRDFRQLDVVTIDGETARDFDDAVWAEHLPNGNFALQVHIADVSHYVRPGSALDQEALRRGTSVYFPDRAVPMLPLELSTEICSLKPHVDRLVMSALLEIDHHGDIIRQEFCRGVIRSAERMSYTAVHALLEGDPDLRARYAPLVPRFEKMRELALLLNRKRTRRGSIDFDLPEALIEFDEFGEMVGVSRGPRNIAHRIIEEFMLAANEAVASHLESHGMPMVFRIHEQPDPQKVFAFDEIASQFGVSLGVGPRTAQRFSMTTRHRDGRKPRRGVELPPADFRITPRHYQKLIGRLEGRPEERILHYLMLRSLKQARYSSVNAGHFALASGSYTHFTSPIRRYPDLLVHRILGSWLDQTEPPYSERHLAQLSGRCSETERTAAEAERELVEWKKLKFMADKVGDEFEALIISTTKFGFFVELDGIFVEGIVPVEHIPGDRFEFHENTRRIIGRRTRREFRIGDRLRVRLDRVNAVTRRLEMSPVVSQAAVRKKGKRK